MSRLHWIDLPASGRLAIAARPRAEDWLADDIAGWAGEGIAVVVSLLEPAEVHDLGLQREVALCEGHGIAFVSFPIPDRGCPDSRSAALRLSQDVAVRLRDGADVLIHCRAGIGRSAVVAACVMSRLGVSAAGALARIAAARGVDVPDTEEQRAWVMQLDTR
ncbi:tyrosine protein phosphatase [Bradyrhizobium sp. 83002]|uniref:phosphatase domain-containing protein n=1 Tax=Bradyrhizobium aeschynomenes TaxID=2734909 RepID=UPI001557081B|nr:protein-tyrosine phosphatase family protein [Bradyrhizobium aeschynomenes]NPU14595.1 tyrosine protein phosphatase [Bradyrhizobium aeschynomenes]NPV21482.1 tyrosine protein phosphatase [Bradyrhizobium aeschynomenes]